MTSSAHSEHAGSGSEADARGNEQARRDPNVRSHASADGDADGRGPICLIVLAAGLSSRMGSTDKLDLPLDDSTVLERTVRAALAADAGFVVVVTGPHDYSARLGPYPVRVVRNSNYQEGMAASIRTGVGAAGADVTGYGIVLGDMPFIRPDTISQIAAHLDRQSIVVPYFDATPGHPVFFARCYRRELLALRGDVGARSVVEAHADCVVRLETGDPGVLQDIDTAEAYRRL